MNKENIKKLLAEGNVADAMDYLLEEIESQHANGPELKEPKELENVATDENKPEEKPEVVDNKEVYPAEEHKEAEEVKEVVVKEEAGNEATEDREPKEEKLEKENSDVYCDEVHEETEDVKEIVIEDLANIIAEYGEVVLEGLDAEDLDMLYEELSNYSLSEAAAKGSPVGQAGQGARQQEIQQKAQKTVDSARNRAIKTAETYNKKAKESWNFAKGAGNFFKRAGAFITGNKERLEALRKEREKGLKDKQSNLNRAQGAIKGYNTRENNVNTQRERSQQLQNDKSVRSNLSQRGLKKGTEEYTKKEQELRSKQSTGERVGGGEIKKNGFFKRLFTGKTYTEALEMTNDELLSILESNGYEASLENLEILNASLLNMYESEELVEDILDSNPQVEEVKEKIETPEQEAPVGEVVSDETSEPAADAEVISPEVKEVADEVNELLDEPVATLGEGFDVLSNLINQINESLSQHANGPELEGAKELDTPAVEDKEPETMNSEAENKEIYPAEEHKQVEEVKDDVAKEENPEIKSGDVEEEKVEKEDIYPAEEHKEAEEVKEVVEVVVEAAKMCSEKGIPATLENITECAIELLSSYEVLEEGFFTDWKERRLAAKKAKASTAVKQFNRQLKKIKAKNDLKDEKFEGSVDHKKSKLAVKKAKEEAYLLKNERKRLKQEAKNAKIKAKIAKLSPENDSTNNNVKGMPNNDSIVVKETLCLFEELFALNENIVDSLSNDAVIMLDEMYNLFEENEKEYDVDAAIESSEMNGNDEEFEEYEELQGEESEAAKSEALKETVNYRSLREACLLDEEYFAEDTYSIQTAEEKYQKLTEQISLLLARESNDPLYEELLRTSLYAQRLQEACIEKYLTEAGDKVNKVAKKQVFLDKVIGKMPEFSLNSVLKKVLAKIKTVKGGEPYVEKIEELLKSGDKEAKRAFIRKYMNNSSEAAKNSAENTLRKSVKKVSKEEAQAAQAQLQEGVADVASKIGKGVATAGGLIILGAAAVAGGIASGGTLGAAMLSSMPLAIPAIAAVGTVATLVITGIIEAIAKAVENKDNLTDY